MKFIHTGDIHYGMSPDHSMPWSEERTAAVKESIELIVSEANSRKVDCLLIAGDLFHRQPLISDLKEVNYLFSTIPDIKVIIIAGNHDRLSPSSAIHSFLWSDNVFYLRNNTLASVYFEDINTEIHGFSYHSREITEDLLADIKAPRNNRIQILMAHGGDAVHLPFNKAKLARSGFSYIALGHIHKHKVLVKNKMAYCGSPEPLDHTETGAHGFIVGEIDPQSRQISSLEFIPSAKVQYISLLINVGIHTTNTELIQSIGREISKRGAWNIFKLKVRGMRDPDIVFDFNILSQQFYIAEIIDETTPNYDFTELFAQHPSDMIGFYIAELNKPDMSTVDKKALDYGIGALLNTVDEGDSI